MEHIALPTWAEGDPEVLAGQFLDITGNSLEHYPTKFYALVAAIAAASVHSVLKTSSPASRQQQIENIRATAAAVVQAFRARPGDNPNAGARGTPAALQKLDKMVQQLQQQRRRQQQRQGPQPEPQLVTVAFQVSLVLCLCCCVLCHGSFRSVSFHVLC